MTFIDAHSHLGDDRVFGLNTSEEELIKSMDRSGIDINLVQPYPGPKSAKATHDRIAKMAQENQGRFFGIASINPHQDSADYFKELSRCVKELGFVGVKLHTIGHAMHPAGADGTTVFDSANQLGIPVMVHTGPGVPFAAPSAVTSQLTSFPNVPVVLAHAGHGIFSGEAIAVAQAFPQVTLEPSWCPFYDIGTMVATLGANRVMFGADLPQNVPVMVETVKACDLSTEDQKMVMGGTAKEFFKLTT